MIVIAEFCLKCLNREFEKNLKEKDVKLSKDETLCEGCGEMKKVVIKVKNA